jgi:hypothetical protein
MLTVLIAAAIFAQATPAAGPSPEDSPAVVIGPRTPAAAAPNGKTVSPLVIAPEANAPPPGVDIKKYTLVCHDETVLGSLFPKKVCATRAEFNERRDIDQDEVRRMQALRPGKSN